MACSGLEVLHYFLHFSWSIYIFWGVSQMDSGMFGFHMRKWCELDLEKNGGPWLHFYTITILKHSL